jgi:hypothetical protein
MDRQTGRQTGMTKLIVAFRNFVNPPKHGNLLVPVGYNRVYRRLEKHNKNFYDTWGVVGGGGEKDRIKSWKVSLRI